MNRSPGDLTLVIPTYNRCGELFNCLKSIEELAGECPVLIVDDGGRDNTAQMLKESFPHVRYLHLNLNQGPARARNIAIRHVKTKYLAFFDSDIVMAPGWVEAVLSHLDPCTVIAGRVERPDGALEWGPRKTMCWGGSLPCCEEKANVASSNNMVIPLELARAIGGFSEELGIYFEDSYFCIRARRAGYRVRYLDCARITHFHDSRHNPERVYKFLHNRSYSMVKDSKAPYAMILVQMTAAVPEMIGALVKKKPDYALACMKGYLAGAGKGWRRWMEKKKKGHI